MSIVFPPPLSAPPPPQSFWQDFKLLLGTQLRVTWNKLRHWPFLAWLGVITASLGLLSVLAYLGFLAYGALRVMPPETGQGFLSLVFLLGIAAQIFFGVTSAFVTLYMSEDLELFFMSPVPLRVVFAVKSLVIANSNLLTALLFCFMPGVFYGLLFQAGTAYYLLVLLVGCGFWIIGTAAAELLNLVVMRSVPPHRAREAVGVIGALAGIIIALTFQLPSMIMMRESSLNLTNWLDSQETLLKVMGYFPWGWGAKALGAGLRAEFVSGLAGSLLLLLAAAGLFFTAFTLLERGFRQGWISLSQGAGGRRKKQPEQHQAGDIKPSLVQLTAGERVIGLASPLAGMWAVAKKDLLYMIRDTREWFGYMVPVLLMMFFVVRYIFFPVEQTAGSMISVLVMYTIMFSGNMALQSFGREGEAEWFLNSVPLAGWPVVWGKLLGAVLPTIVLMQILLVGTAVAIKASASLTIMLALSSVLLTLGASAIGLFYSVNNSRYNPDNPQQRITPGASLLMYLVNLIFMLILALGMVYLIPPAEFKTLFQAMPPPPPGTGFLNNLISIL